LYFESYLEIKENIISRGTIFGRIGVGLWTKDRNPSLQPYPKSYQKNLENMGLSHNPVPMMTFKILVQADTRVLN
jgi:hypothetical protein